MTMEVIAHRGGNEIIGLPDVEARGVDLIEVDVHLGPGGRVEVRHAKLLWPTRRLWERWYLLPRNTVVPSFQEVLDASDSSTVFWLDLKGFTNRLPSRVKPLVAERRPLTVSTKAWWMLGTFSGDPNVRRLRSAGNRFELALVKWLPSMTGRDGVVVHQRLLNDDVLAHLRGKGLVFCWAVEDVARLEWLATRGIDGVILDDLGLVPAARRLGALSEREGDEIGQ